MSYASYAGPGGGYAPYAVPTYGVTPTQGSRPAAKQPAKKAKTFQELPVTGGVGPFHTNHFAAWSRVAKYTPKLVAGLNQVLYDKFCDVFSVKNVASATLHADVKHQGSPTVEFRIGGNAGDALEKIGGLFHADWVVMRKHAGSGSFYGSTLKREWAEADELKLAAAVALPVPKPRPGSEMPSPVEIAWRVVTVNQHHFLAGRRSWLVGYDAVHQRYFVETAALERSSLCEYASIEQFGVMRESIVKIWTHLLENFRTYAPGFQGVPFPTVLPEGYKARGAVAYRTGQHATAAQAVATSWFAPVLLRHPGLVEGLTL